MTPLTPTAVRECAPSEPTTADISPSICWFDRRLVFGPDIAALDAQSAIAIDADEDSRAGDVSGIVNDGPLVESSERGLDFAEPLIDFFWQIVGLGVFVLEPLLFGLQRITARQLLVGEGNGLAGQPAQPGSMAVGKVGRDLDPFPTLGAKNFGFGLEFL